MANFAFDNSVLTHVNANAITENARVGRTGTAGDPKGSGAFNGDSSNVEVPKVTKSALIGNQSNSQTDLATPNSREVGRPAGATTGQGTF